MAEIVKEKIEEVGRALEELKASQKELITKGIDSVLSEKIGKIADDIALKCEAVQKEVAEEKARMDGIEAILNRMDGKSDESKKEEGKAALNEFFRKGTIDGRDQRELVIKSMRTDSDPDGGYLVRPDYDSVVSKRIFESSPLRQLARVVQGSGDVLIADIDDDQAEARWVGQGASGGQTSAAKVGQIKIEAHKMEADPRLTTEQIQDSYVDVESWHQGKVAEKFARTEATAFFSGQGVFSPRGILTYDSTTSVYERGKIQEVNSGTSGSITIAGLIDVQNSLLEEFQSNARWLMKRASFGAILKLNSANNYHFLGLQPSDRGAFTMSILGSPVQFADDMPPIGVGALAVAYGDFQRGYTIYDKAGIEVLRDPYSAKGFVTFYTTKRVGGAVTNYQAIKLMKLAN